MYELWPVNFCERQENEALYAAGADAVSFRYMLKLCAEMGWELVVLDVRVAFLYAPLDEIQEGRVVVLKPPPLLIRLD